MTIGRIPSVEGGIQPTIFDAKADILTATAADTPARLAVGNNGEQLLADSSATTGLRWQGNYAVGKNKIINGDFGIWQRGTSFTLTGPTQTFGADRFTVTGNATYSRQAFTPGTAPVAGYEGQYFARWDITSNSANYDFGTVLEDVRTLAGQTVTLSFWAKASATTSNAFFPRLRQYFGTGGSPSSDVYTDGSNISLTTNWVRYSVTLSLPSISGKTLGTNNNSFLKPMVQLVTTSNVAIDFWGWQLESGSVATAFQTATGTLQGELAACQRYYQEIADIAQTVGYGARYNSTTVYYSVPCPVQMRTTNPTASYSGTVYNEGTSGNGTLSSPSVQRANPGFICVLATCSVTPTSGVAYIITYGKHTFSAEL
jgi:hypothetical protein